MALLPFIGKNMKLQELHNITNPLAATPKMPVLFLGHGSPMNAIEDNEFVQGWKAIGKTILKPAAILCVSAHWETKGTFVTAMEKPKTIHDFGGFPPELFAVQYPAPGSPTFAAETKHIITKTELGLDQQWGLDHGCWSVVKHLYPQADVPVFQMSLDYGKPAQYHYELAKELALLRTKGVLIVGSGNIVHNLRMIAWDKINTPNYGYDWAIEAGKILEEKGISVEVINIHTIKPLDEAAVLASISKTRCAVTVEEHNIIGGLGDSIAQVASKHLPIPIEYIGTKDTFGESGKPVELLKKYGLDTPFIVDAAEKAISRK